MAKTTISWCDHSINPIRARHVGTNRVGHYCEKVSQGCTHCYSSRLQSRFGMPSFQAQRGDIAVRSFLDRAKLEEVLRRKVPTKYFWCDMTDMFGEWVDRDWIDQCFAVMALTPQHVHMVLTKRAVRLHDYLNQPIDAGRRVIVESAQAAIWTHSASWPLSNVWLGVSVENQATANERLPWLMKTPAAIRFVSAEPLLEYVSLHRWMHAPQWGIDGQHANNYCKACFVNYGPHPQLDWVITGGESGAKARPCDVAWLRWLVKQCADSGVACWVKQLGSTSGGTDAHGHEGFAPYVVPAFSRTAGLNYELYGFKHRAAADPTEWAPDLRVQQFPSQEGAV